MALSGESASILLTARQAATSTTQTARGEAARFNELLSAYQAQPRLTGSQLYWQAIVESLSDRPIMVVDPKAGGRKRLFLGGLDDLRAGSLVRDSESETTPASARPPAAPSEQPASDQPPSDRAPADFAVPERTPQPEQRFLR